MLRLWSLLLVSVWVLSGCQVKQELLWHLEMTPKLGTQRLIFHLTYNGVDIKDKEVKVEGNMSHAGMQPVYGVATRQWDGTYIVPNWDFNMSGDWVLSATGTVNEKPMSGYYKLTIP